MKPTQEMIDAFWAAYDANSTEHPRERAKAALNSLAAMPQPEPVGWFNNCAQHAVDALRFLSSNDRPSGGESPFNRADLLDTAHDLEREISRKLYTTPPRDDRDAEIERLRGELDRLRSDRQYIVGYNEGFQLAIEQAAAVADEHALDFEKQAAINLDPNMHDALLIASDGCELTAGAIRTLADIKAGDA